MPGVFLIILCAGLWATDAIFRMPLARSLDSGTIVTLEHALAVVAMLPWFLVRRRELTRLGPRGWAATAFVGIMGSALGTYFFTRAYHFINPSVVIILQKLQPAVTVVAARVFLKERPREGFYGWALVALIGAGLVSLPEHSVRLEPAFGAVLGGSSCALLAVLCWGLSTVFGKFATSRVSFPVVSFLRVGWGLAGMLGLTALGLVPLSAPWHLDSHSLRALSYMALVPGVLATYLYYAGLKRTRASVATFAELFFPVAAVLLNWWVLGIGLTLTQLIGMALLMISVFFVSKSVR